ncbi:MAG: FtsB family cell division protein [Geminicoccaceae bacterium]
MIRAPFNLRRRLRWQSWLVIVGLGLAVYFGYHAVNGSRGLLASQHLTDELKAAEMRLAALERERQALEQNVKRLRPESLDPDLIDELARETLGMVDADDVIILLEPDTVAVDASSSPQQQ